MSSHGSEYKLQQGHLFEDEYRIIRELGRGGFGVIYLARQLAMDRHVALKILKPDVVRHDPNARTRFLREIKIISKLRHPNTVTIHDYGESSDGTVYMVLEFVEGTTLKKILERQGAQPTLKALGIARQTAQSLHEAHRHDVIHRDMKPANIMLTDLEGEADFVKVLDFGVARLRGVQDVDLTQAGVPDGERALIGTPRYMSPEQVKGEELTPASDLYGLGLILYEMLVGEPAVQGDTSMALISQQISPEPLELDKLHALHPRVQDLLRRATDKAVDQRFQTGKQLTAAIDQAAARVGAEQGAGRRPDAFPTGAIPAVSPTGKHAAAQPGPPPAGGVGAQTGGSAGGTPEPDRQPAAAFEKRDSAEQPWRQSEFSADDFDYDDDEQTKVHTPTLDSAARRRPADAPSSDSPPSSSRSEANPAPASASKPRAETSMVYVDDEPDDESRLFGIPSSQLPDAPDSNDSPFADETGGQPTDTGREEPEEETAFQFGLRVAKLCFLATLAAFFVYATFLVIGAMAGALFDGTIRLAVALGVGLAIPLFTALGENSQKERFEVVHRPSERLARVFIGSSIFAAASIVLTAFVMPQHITDTLQDRQQANWMFPGSEDDQEGGFRTFNANLSEAVGDVIQMATVDIGWRGVIPYDSPGFEEQQQDQQQDEAEPDHDRRTPRPTRPATRERDESAPDQQQDQVGGDEPPPDRTDTPPASERRDAPSEGDDDDDHYERW